MKFGKSLSNQMEDTLPEWRDKFLSYKDLKKRLKLIPAAGADADHQPTKRPRVAVEDGPQEDFLRLLEEELEKFNTFFVEKEEEYIIRKKELQDRVARAKESEEEMMKVRKDIVDFHGEMVLLENYSALNYTGLVKILKKYDKRTGALIRLPFIQKVLQQPFFTTDLLYQLVKECEVMLDHLFPKNELSVSGAYSEAGTSGDKKPGSASISGGIREEIEYMESLHMKSTISALRVLTEIRSGSSTVSAFSLPPLQSTGLEKRWNSAPVVEQVAK
nr:SPX domain-containing protein 1 [Lilium speciosum var. gloriosoides]